jgi:tryptophan synthase alpha chain
MSVARLRSAFAKRKALVTYLMAGDGGPEATLQALKACVEAGADVIELGFPFSDPIADGSVIQKAALRSMAAGTTLSSVLELARRARAEVSVPLVLMGYLNPVLAYGVPRLLQDCAAAGVDGLILPDLPPEEAGQLRAEAQAHDVATIFFLAPTSTPERERAVLEASTGFIYFVSVTGVTGARAAVPDVGPQVQRIRAASRVPVAVGFGISSPGQARQMAAFADGVVVGSALVDRLARGEAPGPFVASLRAALDEGGPARP